MDSGKNRRVANVKTRAETGLDYVMTSIDLNTPFGKKILKETKPFFPGEEDLLRRELDKIEEMIFFVKENPGQVEIISETFMEMKDSSYTIERSKNNALSVVEIYELKSLLLQMRTLQQIFKKTDTNIPEEFVLDDTEELLNELDPRMDRINTFYIYDEFSSKLGELRTKKRELEISIRKEKKEKKEKIRKEYGVTLTPKFDFVVSKSSDNFEVIKKIPDLEKVDEDYMSVTFQLKNTEAVYKLIGNLEDINTEIEDEETLIREILSKKIAQYEKVLLANCKKIGCLDVAIAKAIYSINHNLVKPVITNEHIIEIVEGRHLKVEDILISKQKKYCPISMSLKDGVACITGANMGGKTISLKLCGLVAILAQYGFFVPCNAAKIGLSNFMQILIGDSQSVERGLSSFGSEMEELKEILDNSKNRSVLLIDEIASGTNPVEGFALTKSLVDYLKTKPYITLITTHYEAVAEDDDVINLQVRGLADVDFIKLDSELHYANRKERINIISKYMDYRLYALKDHKQIPKDALNIAKMLGISSEIINGAQKYIK